MKQASKQRTFKSSTSYSKRVNAANAKTISKNRRTIVKQRGRAKVQQAKAVRRHASLEARAQQGGLRGRRARRILEKIEEHNAKVEMTKMKPELNKVKSKTQIQTEAQERMTKTKYAGRTAMASALAGGYGAAKEAEARKEEAKAETEKAALDALESSINNIPSVTTDPYTEKSVSGLVTGVR